MFFPARMTRLLVGGHQAHMQAVIETLHREGAVHVEDYQDPTGTTSIGTPLPAGEHASENLVKARGLLKAIGAEAVAPGAAEADPAQTVAAAERALAPVLDAAGKLRADLAALDAEQVALTPYASLDVDLGAVSGLRSVKVFLGQARSDPLPALRAAGVDFDGEAVPSGSGLAVVAVVGVKDAAAAEKVFGAAGFTAATLPPGRAGTPAARLGAIDAERSRLRGALASSTADVANVRAEWGPRLAAAEAAFAIEVEKTQAPLRFGVTQTTFHIEGWVPVGSANRVKNALSARFGESLYFEDLGDASLGVHAHAHEGVGAHAKADHHTGTVEHHAGQHADEHHADDPDSEPPIHLDNPKQARPYEWMLGLLASPRYKEVDPSTLMLVFFPLFFGLMVGDVLVGLAIVAFGVYLKTHKVIGIGGPAVGRALVAGGILSVIIGAFVFGEALGIHFVVGPEQEEHGEMSWEQILGLHIPFETEDHGLFYKTGSDAAHDVAAGEGHGTGTLPTEGAEASDTTLTLHQDEAHEEEAAHGDDGGNILSPSHHTHLSVGGIVNLGYYSKLADALALLAWSLIIGVVHIILGLLIGVRNVWAAHGFTLAMQEKGGWLTLMGGTAIAVLGSGAVSYAGIAIIVASLVMLWMGAAKVLGQGFIALLEIPSLIGNIVSYTRLAAIGASKAGLGLALGVICFETLGGGPVGWLLYVVLFVGIILLAVLSAGLQSLRLQFVEFFGKFYTGGGRPYLPFGRRAD